MDLIADTNIVIAALIRPGTTRALLFSSQIALYSPSYLSEELKAHEKEILEKSGLDSESYGKAMGLVLSNIAIASLPEYSEFETRAKEISPDADDWPFFALSLKLGCAIWSNDKMLKKQAVCPVCDTADLIGRLIRTP